MPFLKSAFKLLTVSAFICFASQSSAQIISEFMAVNSHGIEDEDGDRSDWIELYNSGTHAVNLGGWHLTDTEDDLTKWTFYPTVIAPGELRIVWASNKNRKDPDEELHTNFKLSGGGEYLALVQPDGITVQSEFAPEYPSQVDDVSYGYQGGQFTKVAVTSNSACTVFVPSDDSLGLDWTEATFDDAAWTSGVSSIGYENKVGYESLIQLDVKSIMDDINTTIYTRIPFVIPEGFTVDRALLRLRYDDGFRAYINGTPIADANISGSYSWDEQADDYLESTDFFSYTLSSGGAFHTGTNVLAIHGVNDKFDSSDFLLIPELTVYSSNQIETNSAYYFAVPSPGAGNRGGVENIGPLFSKEKHLPAEPLPTEDLAITVNVQDAEDGVTSVSMTYEIMYTGEVSVAMFDDGLHGDGVAGDQVYGATIPASSYSEGEMIRYRFEAEDEAGNTSRWPIFYDPLKSAEFFGTMAKIEVESSMPVYHWFVDDRIYRPDTGNESRSSLFFNGVLYDNIMTRTRGGSTETSTILKKSFKFDFNRGDHFEFDPKQGKVEEVNLNTTYTDKTYLRRMLSWNTFKDADAPGCISFLVYLRRNNEFFGVQNFEEQVDDDFLQRRGFDENGALYKIRGCPVSNTSSIDPLTDLRVGKETREFEGNEDIEAHITALLATDREDYVFDHMNLAGVLNYMALITLLNDGDVTKKNHYFYRDTEGTGDWHVFPWDKDLTFGRGWVRGMEEDKVRSNRSLCFDSNNVLISAVWNDPGLRALYLRRYRTLLDRFLQPDSTPQNERYYENMIHDLLQKHGANFLLDYQKWGNPWVYDNDYLPGEANTNFTMNIFLNGNRSSVYAQTALPAAQTNSPSIQITHIEAIPASGNQAEEFIELYNPTDVAVDISGWSVSNAVSHVLEGGSIIPANGYFYLSPNTGAFRRRTTSPKGGERLFVQGSYKGMLSSRGETVDLYDADDVLKDTETWAEDVSDAQRYLRISEVMYNPALPPDSDLTEDRLEFIELKNVGPDPLDIDGTFFTAGILFTNPAVIIPAGDYLVVASDPAEFARQYDTTGMTVVGPFSGYLANGNDSIELEDNRGETIQRFTYNDDWYSNTDGDGFSLTMIDPSVTNTSVWNQKSSWRPSLLLGGSPGKEDSDLAPDTIIINEVLAHSDIGGDWIELRNESQMAIDISHWYLSDDWKQFKKYQIPNGTTLPANGLIVLHEANFNSGADAFALSELGDEVILTRALPDGTLQGYQISRDFEASGKDISFGRWTDSEGDEQFIPMSQQTPGTENGAPKTDPILISEIMYHPASNKAEYIELYNCSTSDQNLFDPLYPTNRWSLTDAVSFSFPPNQVLASGEFLIICSTNPAVFRTQYTLSEEVAVLGPFNGNLDNSGERIRLNYPGNPEPTFVPQIQLESVNYKPDAPWPLPIPAGTAIERISATSPANDPASWKLAETFSSPGRSPLAGSPITSLSNAWKAEYFGSPAIPNTGALDDFDHDGENNIAEFIAGTNPADSNDTVWVEISVLPNGNIQVSIPTRTADPIHSFGLQRYYTLRQCPDLEKNIWATLPAVEDVKGTGQTIRIEQASNSNAYTQAQIELK